MSQRNDVEVPAGGERREGYFALEAIIYPPEQAEADTLAMVRLLEEIADERWRQDEQWGGSDHDDGHNPGTWELLITSHVGRLCDADGEPAPDYRQRLIKVAALAVAAAQVWDRSQERKAEGVSRIRAHLQDKGQDFLWFDIVDGVIVGCGPLQEWVWRGKKLTATTFAPGDEIIFATGNRLAYRVTRVEPLQRFRPSNGTIGASFHADWCARCAKDGEDGNCDILTRTLVHDVTDPEYPDEWLCDGSGAAWCTAFTAKE